MNKEDCQNEINTLIRQNRSFAAYRIPGENKFHFVGQTHNAVRTLHSVEELNGQSGFVIAPFQVSTICPIVLIEANEDTLVEIPDTYPDNKQDIEIREQPSLYYKSRFDIFTKSLLNKEFDKLVLSRQLTIRQEPDFSPTSVFYKACQRYTRSYVYLCHTPQTGTWLGSTPERLLSGEGVNWHTVALAGTQPLLEGKLPETWNEKNREEQQLVAAYIRSQLLSFNIRPEEEGPYTVRAGELAHLKSDFRFLLPDNNSLGNLLRLLHPTPAVCGLPKEEAFRFILNNEGYNRRYYSGFIGRLNPCDKSDLYVNLRCMQIEDKYLTLYAGGGLLASSILEEEWKETEDKLSTMLRMVD